MVISGAVEALRRIKEAVRQSAGPVLGTYFPFVDGSWSEIASLIGARDQFIPGPFY